MVTAFARKIEKLDAQSVADFHISNDRGAGDHICHGRDLKTKIYDRANGKDLMGLYERSAYAQVAQEFVSSRENAVLTDPQLGLQACTRILSLLFKHKAGCQPKSKRISLGCQFGICGDAALVLEMGYDLGCGFSPDQRIELLGSCF